jgi:hypothetical protein
MRLRFRRRTEGEPEPDLIFLALQEVMDLSPVNVVVDSILPTEVGAHAPTAATAPAVVIVLSRSLK